ncbi:MAG: helix-turn-helix domain-containing protein [bacterium]
MQIANLAKKLEAVGLTEKQAKVYVAALFLGPAPVQRIAEQAEVNRATTYVIIDELAAMGLVSTTSEGKKSVYVAEPPEAIERYLGSIEKEIADRKIALQSSLKELKEASRVEIDDAPLVRFYKGPEASQAVSDYMRRKAGRSEMILGLSDIDEIRKISPDVLQKSPNARKKKDLSSRALYSGSVELPRADKLSAREAKRLPFKAKGDLQLYKDRATILTFGDQPTGIVIESREIVAILRQLYSLAWKHYEPKISDKQ